VPKRPHAHTSETLGHALPYAALFLLYHNNFTLMAMCRFLDARAGKLADSFRDTHEHVRHSTERTKRHSCSGNGQDLLVSALNFFSSACD